MRHQNPSLRLGFGYKGGIKPTGHHRFVMVPRQTLVKAWSSPLFLPEAKASKKTTQEMKKAWELWKNVSNIPLS